MQVIKQTEHMSYPLHPQLELVMHDLYLKIPSLVFESHRTTYDIQGNDCIHSVKVFNGHWEVGALMVERAHLKDGTSGYSFAITSPHIQVKRGKRNTRQTTIRAEAFKLCSKVFALTPSVLQVRTEMREMIAKEVSNITYNSKRNLERKGEDILIPMMRALMDYKQTGVPTITAEIDKMLSSLEVPKLMDSERITSSVATAFRNKEGIVLREERDGSYTGIHADETQDAQVTNYKTTYDLPELYQTKLAMLKLLESRQPVESIGVKFYINNTNWFFLTSGEIITTS